MATPLLEVSDLRVDFPVLGRWGRKETVRAVDGISFNLFSGKTLGLVGESGSGKSTAGLSAVGLESITGGKVAFRGQGLEQAKFRDRFLRKELQIIFQDPYSSLNPRMKIKEAIAEPIRTHGLANGEAIQARVNGLLEQVGLEVAVGGSYPHELSGGQLQRVCIARAVSLEPAVLICDEPTSALDVSIQAQIVELLQQLQQRLDMALLFISHDLAVVRYIADQVSVMYLGRIVETAPTEELFDRPLHPYTKALLLAAPVPDPRLEAGRVHKPLEGEIPHAANIPTGCSFHTRCPYVIEKCRQEEPDLTGPASHQVACHRWEEILLDVGASV